MNDPPIDAHPIRARRIERVLLAFCAATVGVGVAGSAGLLWVGAPTLALLLGAAAALVAALASTCWRRIRLGALATAAAAALTVAYVAWPHSIESLPTARSVDLTLDTHPLPPPWLGRVPELELLRAGVALGLHPDERASVAGGATLFELYDTPAGSSRSDQRVLDSWGVDRGRVRVLLPAGPGPFPLVVFLHGSGGLFEAYSTLLQDLANRDGVAVALPAYGFGGWRGAAAHARIDATVRRVTAAFPIDANRMVLAGLSAGAMGALRRYAEARDPFCACVAVCGVPLTPWQPRDLAAAAVHLVAGRRDVRIPPAAVDATAAALRAAGARVTTTWLDGDHFALVTHTEQVLAALREATR